MQARVYAALRSHCTALARYARLKGERLRGEHFGSVLGAQRLTGERFGSAVLQCKAQHQQERIFTQHNVV